MKNMMSKLRLIVLKERAAHDPDPDQGTEVVPLSADYGLMGGQKSALIIGHADNQTV